MHFRSSAFLWFALALFTTTASARYIQADPIGLEGGPNVYTYANNAPTMYTDPTGLFVPLAIPGLCAGGGCEALLIGTGILMSQAGKQAAQNSSSSSCEDNKCPPCKTVSGKIVPVGTIAYRPLDAIPDNVKQHGVYGSHHNIFIAKQYPYPKCDCFWQKQKWVAKPDQIQPTWIPIEPFAN